MKYKRSYNRSVILILLMNVLLLFVVVGVMSYVQKLLYEDVRISLTEIVTQNKDVINSKISMEVNNLEVISKQLSEKLITEEEINDDKIKEIFLDFAQRNKDYMLCWANLEGDAVYGDGTEVSVAGRRYFQLALEGNINISERILSRMNGEYIFVISVPMRYKGQIVGTIQKQYTPEEIYNICELSLFSEQGFMYVINSDGYILISSRMEEYSHETENFYRMMYQAQPEASKEVEENIRNNKGGLVETKINGEKTFSVYTPLEQIHDWFLITSININAIIPNSSNAMKVLYVVLFVFLISLSSSILYHLTVQYRHQQKLERIAFVDEVTGGDTFAKFTLKLEKLFLQKPNGIYALLAFDVDGFKYINRFYGFQTGDRILKAIYEHCSGLLLEDEAVARVSSDHFLLLLENVTPERLNQFFKQNVVVDEIHAYLSTGLYPIIDTTESLNLMVDKANLARQKVKGKHFKQVEIYSQKSDEELASNIRMKGEIEKALENDEFVAFFQPKVNINTKCLVGAEALARWITPSGKMISPGDFIPLCEETGLITMVDWRIFEKTLLFLQENLKKGIPCVPISVNFSRVNLLNANFVATMKEKLEQYQVPSNLIEVELTETVIFDNAATINTFIEELHRMGSTVSMDDFGSGYSSLQMLNNTNIDVLKIDKGFLQESLNSERQRVVFEAITQMAKKLDIEIVVEGVETLENVEFMRKAGCTIAQGYYYSKPVNLSTFERMNVEGKCSEKS